MAEGSSLAGYLRRAAVVLFVSVTVVLGWTGFQLWDAWRDVGRVDFDPEASRTALEAAPREHTSTTLVLPPAAGNAAGDVVGEVASPFVEDLTVSLIIGSDQRSTAELSRRADVIMLFILPPGDRDPILLSIPRDLYIANPCTGGLSRANANLNGCGDLANGPEQLAIAVEDFTGLTVDHFLLLDFGGFQKVIEVAGGVEICVEYRVRDIKTGLALPAGCSTASGTQALAWVRSRRTEEFVDGTWRRMPGVNDLVRNQRQQDVLLEGFGFLGHFGDIRALTSVVSYLADAFVIDDGISLHDAISLAWSLRNLDLENVTRPVIPTEYGSTPEGASVLRPTESFEETIRAVYPDADVLFGGAAS
jgi:LCP family protein required for cell wall assembly